MSDEAKTYKLTDKQIATVAAKMRVVQEAQALLHAYIEGIASGLEISGEYFLDFKDMTLKKKTENP